MKEKSKTIEEYVKEELEKNKELIIKNGISGVKEGVENEIKWKISSTISEEIGNLFKNEEVKDSLTKEIQKVKIQIIESFSSELQKVIPEISAQFGANILKIAIKNLTEDSYSMRDLYKKLFN